MYQILQKFDIHWHDGGPSIAMMCHLRRVSDLLYNWKSCLLCYMKDVVLHCSIFFKWNKLVRVRVRVRVQFWRDVMRYQVRHWGFSLKWKKIKAIHNSMNLHICMRFLYFHILVKLTFFQDEDAQLTVADIILQAHVVPDRAAGCARSSRSWCKQRLEIPDGHINDGSWQTTALPSWKAYIKARSLAGQATWCPTTLWVCGREVLAAVSPPQSWYPMDAPASCALYR